MADFPGTWLRALLANTSWNVRPGNSGTCTLRSKPRILGMPGRVAVSSMSSRCASHRMIHIRTHVRSSVQVGVPGPRSDPVTVGRVTETFRADGVRVLITGGTSGLGAAMAAALLDAGALVAITGRTAGRAEAAARDLGGGCVGVGM